MSRPKVNPNLLSLSIALSSTPIRGWETKEIRSERVVEIFQALQGEYSEEKVYHEKSKKKDLQ